MLFFGMLDSTHIYYYGERESETERHGERLKCQKVKQKINNRFLRYNV